MKFYINLVHFNETIKTLCYFMDVHFDFYYTNRTKEKMVCVYMESFETHIAQMKRKLKPKIYFIFINKTILFDLTLPNKSQPNL